MQGRGRTLKPAANSPQTSSAQTPSNLQCRAVIWRSQAAFGPSVQQDHDSPGERVRKTPCCLQTLAPGKAPGSHPGCKPGLCEHWAPQTSKSFCRDADGVCNPLLQPCRRLTGFRRAKLETSLTTSTPGASIRTSTAACRCAPYRCSAEERQNMLRQLFPGAFPSSAASAWSRELPSPVTR